MQKCSYWPWFLLTLFRNIQSSLQDPIAGALRLRAAPCLSSAWVQGFLLLQ